MRPICSPNKLSEVKADTLQELCETFLEPADTRNATCCIAAQSNDAKLDR